MKARIKTTGEYVDVKPNGQRNVLSQFYKADDGRDIPATCLEFEKKIDWEQRRFELVKAAMQGTSLYSKIKIYPKETISKCVIELADAVLAEYRKGEKQ